MPELTPRHIRVFLSSPGDVGDERALALQVLEALPYDPLLREKITVEAVAWDKPGADTPMLATMTPQEAINQGLPKPSECDIVIVVFWSRMGTPLPAEYTKPDGSRFQSGTEWEFIDAVNAFHQSKLMPKRPQVVVYRRTEKVLLDVDAIDFDDKTQQRRRVNSFFDAFVNPDGSIQTGVNLYKSPEEFRQQFERHLKVLIGRFLESTTAEVVPAQETAEARLWDGSPFPGLRAFTPDDAPIFFGRGNETDALIEKLRISRLVAVVGASGSGKSSLAGAGILPRLADNSIEGSKDWLLPTMSGDPGSRVWAGLRFTPGEVGADPFMALAVKLAPLMGRIPRELAAELYAQPELITDLADQLLTERPTWAEVLLFVDQFEELFTLTDVRYREAFVKLLTIISQSTRLRVILTLRADFYARCVEIPALAELLKTGTYPLSAPGTDDLYEMISRPADRAGLSFEKGLVSQILRDTGDDPGALALMAYALDELYRAALTTDPAGRNSGRMLTFASYHALGGVQGAIGKRAEHVFDKLDADAQSALSDVFREIIEVDARGEPTRRRAALARIERSDAMQRLAEALTETRLLVQSKGEDDQPVVEVAHEALLRQWPRLQEWIVSEEADLRLRRQIEQAARDWTGSGRDADYLLVGGRLEEAQRWQIRFPVGEAEQIFIDASAAHDADLLAQEAQRKQELSELTQQAQIAQQGAIKAESRARQVRGRLRIAIAVAGIVGILALIAVGVALMQGNAASNEAATAIPAQTAAIFAQRGEQTQIAKADIRVTDAQNQAIEIGITLQSANTQVVKANTTGVAARVALLSANTQVANAKGTVIAVGVTLTPLAATIAAGRMQVQASQWITQANNLLAQSNGNAETAALLSIRASNTSTLPVEAIEPTFIQARDRIYRTHRLEGHSSFVNTAAFSPDGRYVLTSSDDHTACLWDSMSSVQVRCFVGHTGAVTAAAFSPDGRYVLTGSQDYTVRLWDVSTFQTIRIFAGHAAGVDSVAFSPDGKTIATGSNDGTARLWDIVTGQEKPFSDHNTYLNYVHSVRFSPDGKYLLTGAGDGLARLWDVATGKEIQRYPHAFFVIAVAFSPGGDFIATGGGDAVAHIWDTLTGKEVHQFAQNGQLDGIAFSPDGKYLVTGSSDHLARMWEISTEKEVRRFSGHTDRVLGVGFSPDGKQVVTASYDDTAGIWNADLSQEPNQFLGNTNFVHDAVFSPDGNFILTGGADHVARLWNRHTQQEVRDFKGHSGIIYSAVFSPDGQSILTCGDDGKVLLWETGTGAQLQAFSNANNDIFYSCAFSADGQQVVAAGASGTVSIWDTRTGKSSPVPIKAGVKIDSVAFSPDGKYIVTSGGDHFGKQVWTVRLWDSETGKLIRSFIGHTDEVTSVAFSPNGQYIVTGSYDTTARLWEVTSGREMRRFTGHTNAIWSVAFSPDGRFLLTASEDITARQWEVASGKEVNRFINHTQSVRSAVFSPDGRYILTSSYDKTARLWEANQQDLIADICSHLFQDFTPGERSVYGIPDNAPTCTEIAVANSGEQTSTATLSLALPLATTTPASWTPIASPTASDTPSPTTTPTLTPTLPGIQGRYTGYGAPVGSIAFSPDGTQVLLASRISSSDQTVGQNYAVLIDVVSRREIGRLQGQHTDFVISVAFSPDGKYALTGSRDKTAVLWDMTTRKPKTIFKGEHTDWISGVAFSPDGTHVVTVGKDGQVWLWDANTGSPIRQFTGHTKWVNNVAFSGDGKSLLTGSDDGTARQWSVESGQQIQQFASGTNGINTVAYATTGRYIATGDGSSSSSASFVRVWDTSSSKAAVATLTDPASISSVSFLPGDQTLLITDYEGHVILWDWKNDRRVFTLSMPSGSNTVAAASPDGRLIGVGDDSGFTLFNVQTLLGQSVISPDVTSTLTPTSTPTASLTPTLVPGTADHAG